MPYHFLINVLSIDSVGFLVPVCMQTDEQSSFNRSYACMYA